MQKSLEELNKLLLETPKTEARTIANFMENKLELLKICYVQSYDKTNNHFQNKIKKQIKYVPLRNYLDRGNVKLSNISYGYKAIELHIENGMPPKYSKQAIELYSFYFGGYRELFRCFTKEFLRKIIKLDEDFINDVFASRTTYLDEPIDFQGNSESHKLLNIIPSIAVEESVLRIDILENLFKRFQNNKKVAISGISGIGKTFLAKHFTEHYEGKFSNMVWLNCANGFPKAFSQEKGIGLLGSLGLALEYSSYIGNEKGLMNLVIGHLAKFEGNNLLILDNLDESISNYKDEMAHLNTNWNILGTSQQQLKGFENYSAPDFKKESLDLFYTFYTVEKDDDNLIRLLSAIEYHTLAIELLAKTAQERGLSIIALVNRFTKKGINVVEKIEIVVEHGVEREITIENIEAYLGIIFDTSSLKEEQCKILLNIALLQEDSIPMELFEEVYLNKTNEEDIIDAFNYNFKALVRKGWVQVENERIRIHGLVKNIILKRFLHRNVFFDSTADYLKETLKISGYHVQQSILYLKLSEALLENCTEKSASILLLQRAIAVCYTGIGLFNTSKTIWSNLQADNIYEVISKFHSLTVNAMNQGNSEQAFYYAEHVYSLFAPEVWQEDYSIIISNLETFLKNTQIKIEPIFRANNSLLVQLMSIEMVFNCQSIMTMHDKNKGIIEKINALKQGIFIRDQILSVFEKSISEELLFSIRVYKDFFIRKESYYRYIGLYYVELKEYLKAEEYLKSLLGTIETKLNNEYSILSFNYHSLTVLYLWWEKLEKAKYFIEKNRKICETLPPNHPNTILYKNDIASLEKLEQKKKAEENIYTSIKSKFDLLFAVNNNSTSLWDYYYNLCCIYYDNNDMEKAHDYALKEIRFLLIVGENYNFLANAYIRLGMCCIPLGNLGCADEAHGLVTKLFTENKVNDPEILKKAHRFKDYLVKIAIHGNNLPIMQSFVKSHVLLAEEYCNSKNVSKENAIFNVIKRAFDFLSGLPDLKDNINLMNTTENWVEFLEKKMEAFFVDYDKVFDNSLQEVAEIETFDFSLEEIKYDILREYYQKIGDMFNNCEKWDVAAQYYFRKLFLIESEYINDYKGIESAYYDISFCFFRLGQFEMSYTIICGGIKEIEEILEVQNHHPEYKERLTSALKASLKLEKIVKQKLEEFKK